MVTINLPPLARRTLSTKCWFLLKAMNYLRGIGIGMIFDRSSGNRLLVSSFGKSVLK